MDDFIQSIMKFLGPLVMILLFAGPALLKKKKQPRRPPRDPGGRSELEERVRRNFEELMQRRAGSSDESSETSAPTATTMQAPTEPTPAVPMAVPNPAPVPQRMPPAASIPTPARPRPKRRESSTPQVATSSQTWEAWDSIEEEHETPGWDSWKTMDKAKPRQADAGRLMQGFPLGRDNLRTAILLKEILGPPRALDPGAF